MIAARARAAQSLRFRLTAWYAAILAITFLVLGMGVYVALEQSMLVTVDKDLRARLRTVRSYVDLLTPSSDVSHLVEELTEQSVLSPAAINLRIANAQGNWIYRSPGTEDWNLGVPSRADLPTKGRAQTVRVHREALRVLSAPVTIGVVQIGLPVDEFQEMRDGFLWTIGLSAPLLLIMASLGGYWMSARALKPVDEIARAAQLISAQNLSERLPSSGAGDELDRLSQVLNGMLARLEDAFQRITRFTADASHELRTPVAIIRTAAEVTQARSRTVEEHGEAWKRVLAQTERTSQLIDDLLTLARADAGSDAMAFEPVDLRRTVEDACAEMREMAGSRGLCLRYNIAPEWDQAERCLAGDSDAVRRVLLILIDNGIKATPRGGEIEVLLGVEHAPRPGAGIVCVKDTGIGISGEDLPHIFDRFYRVAQDRSRYTGGAGLGLSIAQWIVSRHGGEIRVESVVGRGSTFRIRLPLAAAPGQRRAVQS
ncbi:MAG TPA: ATP-binding protein [Bryobacteraceae bacterium]|jgi:heavy metal sensor kinase|nr:ATP-binding protein [Bryobacteraceae bacterium]